VLVVVHDDLIIDGENPYASWLLFASTTNNRAAGIDRMRLPTDMMSSIQYGDGCQLMLSTIQDRAENILSLKPADG